ncbi:MAG: polyribonucleotide nucleotidyltransferase, partial [Lentisphaerae bacterium]|nr:polyribonucleotide nucleotidyltransferase [Lentisphaerota bacterium]
MQNTTFVETEIGGKIIRLESGLLARQAQGAVTITLGETILFSAVTATAEPREGIDYFPLQVEYREKFYASGQFPGGFFKREARPSEKEILTARLTDRPIRPLFHETYNNDVQINNMLLSADMENDSDILSITASSAALTISELPFLGPVSAVRIGRVQGEFVVNPTNKEREESDLDLVYAATRDYPVMIEGGGNEVKEEDLIAAMKFAHPECIKLIDAQLELRSKMGLPEKVIEEIKPDTTLLDAAREIAASDFNTALDIVAKQERGAAVEAIRKNLEAVMLEKFPEMTAEEFRFTFDKLNIEVLRKKALEENKRVDGRDFDTVRPLDAQLGFLPRAHGSALFNRGETQALGTV